MLYAQYLKTFLLVTKFDTEVDPTKKIILIDFSGFFFTFFKGQGQTAGLHYMCYPLNFRLCGQKSKPRKLLILIQSAVHSISKYFFA